MTVTDGHSTLAPDRDKKFVFRYTVIGFEIIASGTKFRNEIQLYFYPSYVTLVDLLDSLLDSHS